ARDFPPDLPAVDWQLLVDVPNADAGLNTPLIALREDRTKISHFADAAWTDRAPALVQSLLVQSFENSGRIARVSREQVGLGADFTLTMELRDFQAEYGPGAPGRSAADVRIGLHAKLVRVPGRMIAASQSFESLQRADGASLAATIDAFDQALGDCLARV